MKIYNLLLVLCLLSSCDLQSQKNEPLNYHIPLKRMIDSAYPGNTTINIVIDKSQYRLSVLIQTDTLKQYPVVFGGNPVDDKRMQGDGCTPEGTFRMRVKYPHKSWSKFIWIDYPNEQSWQKFNQAKAKGEIPQEAKIGGEIGIHGVPGDTDFLVSRRTNWTLGCISMKNKDVNEIYPYITKESLIVILK